MGRPLALVCALALVLAACGGSGASTQTVTHTVTSPAASASTKTSATTQSTASATTPGTTTSAATPPCTAHELSLSFLGQQGAAGHGELGFALKNTSSAACHTYGFPGIQFLDRSGAALTTIPHRTTIDYFGHTHESELTLTPGATASFRLGVTHGAIPGSVCSTAYFLQVIPPDDVNSVRTQIAGGAYECRDATVSPLESGNSAYP